MRAVLAAFVLMLALAIPTLAFAGEGNGTSNSQGANHTGNAVSSGATPQPK